MGHCEAGEKTPGGERRKNREYPFNSGGEGQRRKQGVVYLRELAVSNLFRGLEDNSVAG